MVDFFWARAFKVYVLQNRKEKKESTNNSESEKTEFKAREKYGNLGHRNPSDCQSSKI